MGNRIEMTPRLKWLISGTIVATCGLLLYIAGDLINALLVKQVGAMMLSVGVITCSLIWILGLTK